MPVSLTVDRLIRTMPAFGPIIAAYEADSVPAALPLTLVLGDLGRALVANAVRQRPDEVALVFDHFESILTTGTEDESNAAATGFLEGVASALDGAPEQAWILEHARPAARRYLAAWDEFCGVTRG